MKSLEENIPEPADYPCRCIDCSWRGHVSDCTIEKDSDGWEYPEYDVALCPICGADTEI